MSPRVAILVVLGIGACADDKAPPGDPYDVAVANYIEVACTSACRSGQEDQCRADVSEKLTRVKLALDAAAQARCITCLDTKAGLVPELAACMPTADQTAMVVAACDLDPTIDSDGDGIPDNDYSEACGGEP